MPPASWTDAESVVNVLLQALDEFDWTEAERECGNLVQRLNAATEPFPAPEAKRVLQALRRKRQFALMALVADAFIDGGRDDAEIYRQFGQAQIELGQLKAAETTLRQVIARPDTPRREWAEAMGLLGRINKQRYVDVRQPGSPRQQRNLAQAVRCYHEVYASAPAHHFWQGINTVALLARAERDKVGLGDISVPDFRDIARAILQELAALEERDGGLQYRQRATSMEAHIALGDFERARADLREYVTDHGVDAFECAGTLRQLRELWELDDENSGGPGGGAFVEVLKGALLRRQGGEIELQANDIKHGLEVNFQHASDLSLKWWQTGLSRCATIARIEDTCGRRIGSGFLVRREDFLGTSGPPLMLTNWHVVSAGAEHPLSIRPEAAQATFEATGRTLKVAAEMPAYCRALDASFLDLENVGDLSDYCPILPAPAGFLPGNKSRLYVIGYPGGRGLSFSIHDSVWLDTDETRLHYRTPTEGGSSGSPVFDQANWTLIALHHAGKNNMRKLKGQPGTYQANEGIAIAAIQQAVRATPRS